MGRAMAENRKLKVLLVIVLVGWPEDEGCGEARQFRRPRGTITI